MSVSSRKRWTPSVRKRRLLVNDDKKESRPRELPWLVMPRRSLQRRNRGDVRRSISVIWRQIHLRRARHGTIPTMCLAVEVFRHGQILCIWQDVWQWPHKVFIDTGRVCYEVGCGFSRRNDKQTMIKLHDCIRFAILSRSAGLESSRSEHNKVLKKHATLPSWQARVRSLLGHS